MKASRAAQQVLSTRLCLYGKYLHDDLGQQRAAVAEMLDESASVDAVDAGHALLLEPIRQRARRSVVTELLAHFAHNQRRDMHARGLEGLRETPSVDRCRGNTVVSEWISNK